MSKKNIKRIVLLLVAGFCVFEVYSVVSLFIPRQGTARGVADLQKVFGKAGRVIGASFTNSIVQKLPIDGPIHYRLIFFKEPLLILSGCLNTNLLHAFITANTNTTFLWAGAGNEHEVGWPDATEYSATTWTNIEFRSDMPVEISGAGIYSSGVDGKIDLQTGVVRMSCSGSDGPAKPNR